MAEIPTSKSGEISGWPKLKMVYRTDPDRIADLLPPGITPGANPFVHIGVYCVPILGEPEFGVSTKIEADFDGIAGYYNLGMGIDQEAAVFNSQQINGQPKFPCSIKYFRLGDHVEARCTHQGYTFLEFRGNVTGQFEGNDEAVTDNEWWIKVSRAIGNHEKQYDFPPHVVRVAHTSSLAWGETLEGSIVLRDSPWDPLTELLPMREQVSATLEKTDFISREITNAGPLDPDAFWPHCDVISGSRWPGQNGGPRWQPAG